MQKMKKKLFFSLFLPYIQPICLWRRFECLWKDLELPLSKQPKRLQARVIDYFDAFMSYKNERTCAACTENAMQLMFQLSLSYYEMLFTDPRNLRLTEAESGRVASIFWIFTLVVKMVGIISSGKWLIKSPESYGMSHARWPSVEFLIQLAQQ